jgi:hypothetical protein
MRRSTASAALACASSSCLQINGSTIRRSLTGPCGLLVKEQRDEELRAIGDESARSPAKKRSGGPGAA